MQTLNCALIGDTADPPDTMPAAQRALFASLAQVCRALTGQAQVVDWTAAARAVDETASETNCWIVAVRGMLGAAVAAHAADPTAPLQAGPAEPGTACPVGVREVAVDSSTPGGAYTLRIQGPYLFQVTGVSAGGAALDWVAEEDLGVDPPLVTLTATGAACLPAGQQVSVLVSGPGYQAGAPFTPGTSLGACRP
jgi:hypothetical protein